MADRLLPLSATNYLDELEERAKELHKIFDNVVWYSNSMDWDMFRTERLIYLKKRKDIQMDIDEVERETRNIINQNLSWIDMAFQQLSAIQGMVNNQKEWIDKEIGRYGLDYDSFFGEDE
jgi:hypothetical protein